MPEPKPAAVITTKLIPRGEWQKHIESVLPMPLMPPFDICVYNTLERLAVDTRQWGNIYELNVTSNGSLYLAPDRGHDKGKIDLRSPNGSAHTVSADAAGLIASLFVFSQLSFGQGGESASKAYHRLLKYAYAHQEAGVIGALID